VASVYTLSARRKKRFSGGVRVPRVTSRSCPTSKCDARVRNRQFEPPPSGFMPIAMAIASASVDLPEPFSPTRNVTAGCRASPPRNTDNAGTTSW
jgi:hypothetical protein